MTGRPPSVPNSWRESVVMLVGGITVLAGGGQILFRERALTTMGLTPSSGTLFLFLLVSALTGLFGCGVLHAWFVKQRVSLVICGPVSPKSPDRWSSPSALPEGLRRRWRFW